MLLMRWWKYAKWMRFRQRCTYLIHYKERWCEEWSERVFNAYAQSFGSTRPKSCHWIIYNKGYDHLIILALIVLGIVMHIALNWRSYRFTGVFGVAAIGILGYSVYLAFINCGIWAGMSFGGAYRFVTGTFHEIFKTKAGRKMQPESVIDGKWIK